MVSKESNHSLAQCNNTSKEKAMTVRSVLLNRDSPDIESRLKRRRNRTQQVRFKDQVDSADEHLEKNNTNSQTAKSALYKKTASLASVDTERREATPTENISSFGRAPCQARRRHWYQSRPCSLTLPNPKKVSMSTAIQTSPSLQKHFPAFRFRSKSVSDFEEEELMVALASHREKKQLAARNYMQLSGCNGETNNFRTLNGGDQVEKDSCLQNNHQSTFTPALQVSDRHPRRKQVFSPYPQLSLARGLSEEQSSQGVPENGTHHKQITHKEFVSNSPEYHHPFYPTNVASLDFGKKSVSAPLIDAALPPQQTPPVKAGESELPTIQSPGDPELPTIQSPQGRLCEERSDCVKDPKSENIHASETSASLQNELPSSLSYKYPQNTPSKKTVNCNRPLPSTQTSQDTEHRGSTPPHETQHTSPRTLGVLSPLDHKSATSCSSHQIIDVDCLTPSKKQEETLPTKSSTSLLANPATFRKEYTEIPDTSAIVGKSCLLNVKEDYGQFEQREGSALILDSNTKLLSGISEKDYSILDPQQEELCVPPPSLQSGDQTDPFNSSLQSQTQDPLDEYYTVRTRETPPEPTAVENRYPVPVVEPCLPADQSETLRQVQGLLELVAAAKRQVDLSKGEEGRLSQGRLERVGRLPVDREAGPKQKGDVSARLQALEGVLETSQQTIKVLLDVIQDLEKKEAQRDGRHSYRTGQDIENCGTCRDCACIIYSVEHDFRLQEGRFLGVLRRLEDDTPQSSPHPSTPNQSEPSPVPKQPPKLESKRSKRKCFWFL